MTLQTLTQGLSFRALGPFDGKAEIRNVAYNSKNAGDGVIFVCLVGASRDGHDFAADVYEMGTRIFVTERALPLPEDATQLVVSDTRQALALLSAAFFDHPEKKLRVIGVTGTKGKSTICEMIRHILTKNGIAAGSIGTVGIRMGDVIRPTGNTTPESYELFKIFDEMVKSGMEYAVMEVSSQGIKMDRIFGISFFAAVMTNLSEDHIGIHEHPDFDDYKQTKMKLFERAEHGVFNADDRYFTEFLSHAADKITTYGIEAEADITASQILPTVKGGTFGTSFLPEIHGKPRAEVYLPAPGSFSVSNALAALSVCHLIGIPLEKAGSALADVMVRGRFEIVQTPLSPVFVIDYAHNGESLTAALMALRAYGPKRLICLFGSVGGRTQIRRHELGIAAARYADFSILTSDNPDDEPPMDILADIEKHMADAPRVIIPDRKEAIEYAVRTAASGDIVLFAGKGHESYQLIEGKKLPFSEKDIITKSAARLAASPKEVQTTILS